MISQLNLSSFKEWRDSAEAGELPVVLDVREPWELQTASVVPDGFRLLHIPMRDVPARLGELEAGGNDQPIACLCHHGMRSLQVGNFLEQRGFTAVVNLQGGIDAWSQQVDATIPRY
ncbi:MAG: rhodanese-like domain-containing protein [Pseudomonadota bacterium]